MQPRSNSTQSVIGGVALPGGLGEIVPATQSHGGLGKGLGVKALGFLGPINAALQLRRTVGKLATCSRFSIVRRSSLLAVG